MGVVIVLGTTQTLAWASTYYLPAILADRISDELGMSSTWFFAAFSASLVVAAMVGPRVGRTVDAIGGREMLAASNVIIAAGLVVLAFAHSQTMLWFAWLILGLGMGVGLYDTAFATLGRIYGRDARSAITGITLVAGFASTIGWPLTAWGASELGWRETCLAWAAANVLLGLPLNYFRLPKPTNIATPIQNDADWVRPDFGSLAGGVSANGVAVMFCGLVGSCGINTYSSSIGLSDATGVTSRSIGYATGLGFCVLAFIPPTAVALAAMPLPVMGAALFFTAAFVFTSGLQMITARMLDARKTLVIGFSFAMAVVADLYHEALMGVPIVLQPIFGNSLVLGTVCAVVLNLIMRIGVRQRVAIKLAPGGINREAVEQFLSEQGGRWAARRERHPPGDLRRGSGARSGG